MTREEEFTGRWGLVLATLGMAVGTGNIWRFPRIAATHGGGSFLIAWVVFLVVWSLPLVVLEYSFGKTARRGVVGAFDTLSGGRFRWMGVWVAVCTSAIMFYYAVVAGWCLRFLIGSSTGEIARRGGEAVWNEFAGSGMAVVTHAAALGICVLVVWFGVRGIERMTKVLIPALLVLVIVLAIRAVTLDGAERGLAFLFTPDFRTLAEPRIWLEALTQNAWDSGAGWGLALTYAVYMKKRSDVSLNASMVAFGNNAVSLLAGIMVLCTVFALNPDASDQIVGAGNEGITFVWMPQLFEVMPAGGFFMFVFFLALTLAAITSLISMLELATRVLIDYGLSRRFAVVLISAVGFVLGVPSALSMDFLANQDWVWGVGLILSGLFFALTARRYDVERLRTQTVNGEGCELPLGRWWTFIISVVVPVEAVTLLLWWLGRAMGSEGWHKPFEPATAGTLLLQWSVVLGCIGAVAAWRRRRAPGSAGTAQREASGGQP